MSRLYGLDAELAARRDAKYDAGLEAEAREFITAATGEKLGSEFHASLKDGVVLAILAKTLVPAATFKINTAGMPFKERENISNFLKVARNQLGVREYDLFSTDDLYDAKNMNQVVMTIHAVGRAAQKLPGYSGPTLGPKTVAPPVAKVTKQRRNSPGLDALRMALEPGTPAPAPAPAAATRVQWAKPAGATPPPPLPTRTVAPKRKPWETPASAPAPAPAPARKPWEKPASAPAPARKPWQKPAPTPAAPGPAPAPASPLPKYGLDAELAARRDAKYDVGLEAEAKDFIAQVTGERIGSDFHSSLKDGVVLAILAKTLVPAATFKINTAGMPFKERENISNFLKVARNQLGVREYDLFSTDDLYDAKNMNQVVTTIHAVGRAAQKLPGYSGPTLGVKEAAPHAAPQRSWGPAAGGTKLTMGSHGTMERSALPKGSGPTFGASAAGRSVGGISKLSMGSAGVMERTSYTNAADPTFGAQASGRAVDGTSSSFISSGSSGTMARTRATRPMDATYGADAAHQ